MKLRDYQQKAIDAVYKHLRKRTGTNPCIVIPTGGGKTPIIATICKDCSKAGYRVVVLSHVKELLEQSEKTLKRIDPSLNIGVFCAGLKRKETDSQITLASIQSIAGHVEEFSPFNLIIVDEAHLIPTDSEGRYNNFIEQCRYLNNDVQIIGLTATPFRTGSGMICKPENILNTVCYEVGVKELIQKNFLTKVSSKDGKHTADFSKARIRNGEFRDEDIDKLVNVQSEIQCAVTEIIERTKNKKSCLIFASSINHAFNVQQEIKRRGFEAGLITGITEPSERARIIRRFKGEKVSKNIFGEPFPPLKFLVNVNVLTTGFDAPNIDCVVLMRPTISPVLYVQMVGRGMRLYEGKEECLILDYGENILRHGCIDDIKLKIQKKGEAPSKKCPKCQEVLPASCTQCTCCGYMFPPQYKEPKITKKASTKSILSGEEETKTVSVFFATYEAWNKNNSKTVRIVYSTKEEGFVSEWICPEHTGWALDKFKKWWQCRSEMPCGRLSVEEIVTIGNKKKLKTPAQLVLKREAGKKYWNIKKAIFDQDLV